MHKIICALLLFVCTQKLFAQSPYFQKILFPQKNQSVQVNVITQSRAGYLWLGTDHGLYRFDGINFKQFDSSAGTPHNNNVTALAEDSVGRIWIGYNDGRISILENNSEKPFAPEEGLSSKPISKILFDKRGILWFSTLNDGLYYYRNNRLYRLDDMDGMPDIFVYDIEEDDQGNVWAATDGGAAICSFTKNEIKISTISSAQGLPDNIVKKIVVRNNKAWFATEDAGVVSYDLSSKKIEKPFANWPYGKAIDVLATPNQLWTATNQGLLSSGSDGAYPQLTKTESITTLFQDAEENVWLGLKNGIMRTPGNKIQFIRPEDNKKWDVAAVLTDQLNNVWFATAEGLFKRGMDGVVRKQLTGTSFEKSNITSLYLDARGFVWAGLYDKGVLKINTSTNQASLIKDGLRNNSVLNITGFEGGIWLATLGGASRLTFAGEKVDIQNYSSENGLSTDYIYQVFVDSKKRVWFATDRAGIDMLDQNGFHHYKDQVNQKVIYGFAEDGKKQLWANVQGAGLFQFDGNNFIPFTKQNILRESNISTITANDNGALVISHDNGIDVYDPESGKVYFLGEESGIKDQAPNLNAAFKNVDGKIFIGTTNGLIVLSDESKTSKGPLPIIEGLDVYNVSQSFSRAIDLKHDQNNLTIRFTGLWYQDPQNLTYQFQLENHDNNWIETHDRSVSFSQLPPGDYLFHLRVSESADFEKANEATLSFSISPPFWRTYPFYIFTILLLGFSGYSFLKYRERQLKADKLELEKLVYERTMEIERNNEEIKAQAEEIQGINENLEVLVKERTNELEVKNKALEEYAFINAHQLRAPVASILGLINIMKDIPLKDEEKACMDHLQASAKKLDDVVNSITQAIERGDYSTPLIDPSEFSE